ncbi:MAG TPA: Hpt domain-containing protein [Flavisolibacter sp.]|nr:Hpt domain-containing protein [Flavisolibacter sp.]
MNESLFNNVPELDSAYLEAAYGDDSDTAAMVFQQYLDDLPANLDLLNESYRTRDIDGFRHHIHKQKPGFSYVGLTDVTEKFHELQVKCLTKEDLNVYKNEIDQVLLRIHSATPVIQNLFNRLQSS